MKPQYPLVFSTLLIRLGVGVIITHIVMALVNKSDIADMSVTIFSTGCILLGVILSMTHLGKPQRFLHAFSNPSSMLTWEAVIMPLLIGSMLLLAGGAYGHVAWLAAVGKIGTVLFGLMLIYVTAKVYHLKARPAWSTPLVVYEFFISAVCMGILGYIGIMAFVGKPMDLGLFYLIKLGLVMLIAEFVVTLYYRHYVKTVSMTSSEVLRDKASIIQHYLWIGLGLVIPFVLCVITLLTRKFFGVMVSSCFVSFFLGAMFWRVLFFKTATPLKITPDIADK
jgi:DMSO reductase anchor subunit